MEKESGLLRLGTTTSVDDSGLLGMLLGDFESKAGVEVDVIAVGTGQALALGVRGDVDVVLVHARALEEAFVAAGDGVARFGVMYNDFVVVGPIDDPAGVRGASSAKQAFEWIASIEAEFVSRGDNSGTHTRE
ncbi:MAG: substrate-binding domain-containing protein, partial [Anaerolineae bacterium]|nr:substrate-binding domain-containing protein [Anaerolineae bacterium]